MVVPQIHVYLEPLNVDLTGKKHLCRCKEEPQDGPGLGWALNPRTADLGGEGREAHGEDV